MSKMQLVGSLLVATLSPKPGLKAQAASPIKCYQEPLEDSAMWMSPHVAQEGFLCSHWSSNIFS